MRWSKAAMAFWTLGARSRAFGVPRTCSRLGVSRTRRLLTTTTTRQWGIHEKRKSSSFSLFAFRGGYSKSNSVSSSSSSLHMSTSSSSATTKNKSEDDTATQPQRTHKPIEYFRKEYEPLNYHVDTVAMKFQLLDKAPTRVTTTLQLSQLAMDNKSIVLDGDAETITLHKVEWNGQELTPEQDYTVTPTQLLLHPRETMGDETATLTTTVTVTPETNTALSGLYKSGGGTMYCTQCEAMGFRRITYYPDRPDVMAVFDNVRIEADSSMPLLLSNGNLIEQGVMNDKRHYAVWSDPFPKPSYLFALVAASTEGLGVLEDTYTTLSGRVVQLRLYAAPSHVAQLRYAMSALQRSMQWDEQVYGLEYDLDLYNVVAVADFNMGAMENKSLNVFNTAYVLADTATATDTDFQRVEAVIGHEYFHNWTGNRVTCRDWFQLTLKEGLTVFRDQEFSADMMQSAAVKRIEDVRSLRARQFPEDAGPLSHPIRPESYISMDNFYTATVYVKGAEIVRMYQTLLGKEGFRKGMDLYFQRHDGSAVTCDDFLAAMADANLVDLHQFSRWYSTPGTPTVEYSVEYKEEQDTTTLELTMKQSSQSTEGPLHIPIAVGLLDKATGEEVVPTTVLELKEETQTFSFKNLKGTDDVVLSLLRGFSAPIKLVAANQANDDAEEAMAFLAAYDTDGFNRWEAGQKLYTKLIFQAMSENGTNEATLAHVEEAFRRALESDSTEHALLAYTMTLPSESTLAEEDVEMDGAVDPIAIHKARGAIKQGLARKFQTAMKAKYDAMTKVMAEETELTVDAPSMGRRQLRNVLLEYLCSIRESETEQIAAAELATQHYENSKGMTDKMAAFACLASMDGQGAQARDAVTRQFYEQAKGDDLVLNKWFTVQATADLPDVLDRVKKLKAHPDFTLRNPNRCRSLIGAYASGNTAAFHDVEGKSYEFLGEVLTELDKLNPQVSSRMAGSLIQWRKYSEERGQKMRAELEKLASSELSADLYEIVNKGLK